MLTGVNNFDFLPRTRIVFGENSLESLGELAVECGGRRVLLVTDAGIVRAGHAERARQSLAKEGLFAALFDGVHENPTTRHVADCVAVARQYDIDFIVGLGGGSSMDTAKGANFIFSNGGKIPDYWGVNKAKLPMLPMISVPTTAGTGSECQAYALIADEKTHQKMACGDDKAYARVALLDPVLTLSQPRHVTANTGIDTVAHAVEAHVTTARTPLSQLFSREAWRLAQTNLEIVLRNPGDLQARGRMLLASAYGGIAIAQSMLGAAHSAANPLTAHFGIIHGQAVGMMLAHVVRFNCDENSESNTSLQLYAELAVTAGLARHNDDAERSRDALINRINELLLIAEIPSFIDCPIPEAILPTLAKEAAGQWTAQFNPRKPSSADFLAIYRSAANPRKAVNGKVSSSVKSRSRSRRGSV